MSFARICDLRWRLALLIIAPALVAGCSRERYRLQADHDAYALIAERNTDPRWHTARYSIDPDPNSRFFDPYDPDFPPMPPDDPASAAYMQQVAGYRGWKGWGRYGMRAELENPRWRQALAQYVPVTPEGAVILSIPSALRLAYMHSPLHQRQLETLYQSALDVSAQRFRLDTQFFGGYDVQYAHRGRITPPAIVFDSLQQRYVVVGPTSGVETNRLTVGRPFGGDPALLLRKELATAGEVLAGFANAFVVEFTRSDVSLSSSVLNFSLIQPLLRGAGREIALEGLTFAERVLLANLRAYAQFRQGFYTFIAIGELGVSGPQRGGPSTNVSSFSGQGSVGGFLGLLQQLQRIRNTEDNLTLQVRTLRQLEALLNFGLIDLVQVDQFRQSVESERSALIALQNAYELALDRYKVDILGLPPDLAVVVDDSPIRQFQLVDRRATALQDQIVDLQDQLGQLGPQPRPEILRDLLQRAAALLESVRQHLADVEADVQRMDAVAGQRLQRMSPLDQQAFQRDRQLLGQLQQEVRQRIEQLTTDLVALRQGLTPQTLQQTRRGLVAWTAGLLRLVQQAVLVQARARLEAIVIPAVELDPDEALRLALANRLDFMNARAALVDQWRQIHLAADMLQGAVNITSSGELFTARNNPFSFRSGTGTLRLGLEVDAPLTRLLERNAYREALIQYQQARRQFIQSQDHLQLAIRALLRDLDQLRNQLEIQRRAVAIAIRRVDLTQAELYRPVPPPQPGQPAGQFGPTAAINLLSAFSSLRDSQNGLVGVWLQFEATRMRLARELGVMPLDAEGNWLPESLPGSGQAPRWVNQPAGGDVAAVPPAVPASSAPAAPPSASSPAASAPRAIPF